MQQNSYPCQNIKQSLIILPILKCNPKCAWRWCVDEATEICISGNSLMWGWTSRNAATLIFQAQRNMCISLISDATKYVSSNARWSGDQRNSATRMHRQEFQKGTRFQLKERWYSSVRGWKKETYEARCVGIVEAFILEISQRECL